MGTPATVDDYMAALPAGPRRTLEKLRATIKAIVPEATETISYQMPAFRLHGRFLVSFAAFKDHCSFFPASHRVVETLGHDVQPYLSGKGTLRFTVEEPIPAPLVRKIVKARIEETMEAAARKPE